MPWAERRGEDSFTNKYLGSAPLLVRMRAVFLVPLALLVPFAAADSEMGASFGLDLGNSSPGAWDVWQFDVGSGGVTLSLSWTPAQTPIPYADYNLFLYPPGSFNDFTLANNDRIAAAWHGQGFQPETISVPLAAGRYYVAVAPWQTQGEVYTLTSSTGSLNFAATAVGVQSCSPCP